MSDRAIQRWKRGSAAAKALMARSKITKPTVRFPIEKFAADLGKLLDGHDKLYYRFGVDEKLDLADN